MSSAVIKVENLSKQYRLGLVGTGTLSHDLNRAWARLRGKEDPYLKIGDRNDRTKKGESEYVWALSDVSFDVKQGEILGIVGRNGAGKSTLLKILAQITRPTHGTVKMKGRVGSLLEVGTGFHADLSGRENIFINGAILGMRKREIQKKLDEIISFAGVERYIDTPVKRYSSGMMVRLGFSVAAHLEPEILIVDEVLAVGDAEFQKKCIGKMSEVSREEGRTILFVTHNMVALQQMCNSALFLNNGTVEAKTFDVSDVVSKYNGIDFSKRPLWESQGDSFNPYFNLKKAYLDDSLSIIETAVLSKDSLINLNLIADVEEEDPSLTMGYALYDKSGNCLYWSYQTDDAQQLWPKLKKGTNHLITQLPLYLLNEGDYVIEIIGGLNHRKWILEPGYTNVKLSFSIQGKISESPLYMSKRPTVLAPILKWRLNDPR